MLGVNMRVDDGVTVALDDLKLEQELMNTDNKKMQPMRFIGILEWRYPWVSGRAATGTLNYLLKSMVCRLEVRDEG
jgi:hypothetical protein